MATWFVASGQSIGRPGTVRDPTPPKTPTPSRRTSAPVKDVKSARLGVRTIVITPTTGSLSVAAESNATILVEPINIRNAQAKRGVLPDGERLFIFGGLKPGRYRVAGALAGHQEVETEVVIEANKNQKATLNFRPILYAVNINTNVSAGELRYALEGQPLSNVVAIQNKTVQLKLRAGKYVVEIRAAEADYESLSKTFSLTEDQTVLNMQLKRIEFTTETLTPKWTDAELQIWDMPAAWRPDSKKNLTVKGIGLALPRNEGYHYYKDFKLSSTARMLNGVGLSFALRAQDSKNYYLLQLTGEKSEEPNTVRLYVVKNGLLQRVRAITIPAEGAKSMRSGQFFTVSIKMIDFTITVEIEDSETGTSYPLGGLTDSARSFDYGAVGIAGQNNEENLIASFVVCSGKCLTE